MILAGSRENPDSQNIVITPSIITVIDRSAHVITVQSVHGASEVKEYAGKRNNKKLEDILRLIELCKAVQSSSVNPFEVDIREKLLMLKKHIPEWKIIDVMLKDSEALHQLVQIVKLQDQWIKTRASSLYIDPLLLELKIRPADARRTSRTASSSAGTPWPRWTS